MSISSRLSIRSIALTALFAVTSAQLTLTGCTIKDGQEVCLLPGGTETTILQEAPVTTAPPSVGATTTGASTTYQTTAVTACHQHGAEQFCVKGNGEEVQVILPAQTTTGSDVAPLPTAYTGCHGHGSELWCLTPDGGEVEMKGESSASTDGDAHADHEGQGDAEGGEEENCHFHAGVEHCVGHGESESSGVQSGSGGTASGSGGTGRNCGRRDREYNVKLRIGLLFVILVTSAIGVYAPILMTRVMKLNAEGIVFTIVKQFGTGIIIATALIHLATHAELMFANPCLAQGGHVLKYEATTTSIMMAGAFVAFLVDFLGHRIGHWRRESVAAKQQTPSLNSTDSPAVEANKVGETETTVSNLAALGHHHPHPVAAHPNDSLSVIILETGIIFHSILLGITLVVAGDTVFITLFIVIVFHQMFEGLALGARIASISGLPKTKYIVLPLLFAFITPIGMAIGIGLINNFNGNDPSTILALGTLDAVSAGILLWVGFVSMWATDWIFGELSHAPVVKTGIALISLMAGMALMGLLGKWA